MSRNILRTVLKTELIETSNYFKSTYLTATWIAPRLQRESIVHSHLVFNTRKLYTQLLKIENCVGPIQSQAEGARIAITMSERKLAIIHSKFALIL